MRAGARLALYGVGLLVAFGGAFVAADALVPESFVAEWADDSASEGPEEHTDNQGGR